MQRLIGPGLVITCDQLGTIIENGGLLTSGDAIVAAGPFDELMEQAPDAVWLNGRGRVIMPGLINAHGHFYGMLARGMGLKDPAPRSFRQVLERLWWRLDKALDANGIYLSAAIGGIAAIRAGCTTVIDHHASANAIDGSLAWIAEAMDGLGLRACLAYEVSDRDGPDAAAAGIAENLRFARSLLPGGRLAAKFGLHAPFTVGEQTMAAARQAEEALGTGFHLHCAEGPDDQAESRSRYGKSAVQRLYDEGILGERTILAHCVQIDQAERAILAQTGTWVTHQPHSNLSNAVGWAGALAMREQGVRVALGTDGYTFDMLESMRTAAALHAHGTGLPGTGVEEFGQMLTGANAALASATFGRRLGVLEPGAAADIILLDYRPPTPLTAGNLPYHLQFGLSAAQVDTVLVAGTIVMQGREILGLDEEELAARAQQVALATWERF